MLEQALILQGAQLMRCKINAEGCLFSPQGEYSGFVYSYAVEEPLSVVHKVAGYLPSLFWGFITLGRLISIPVSYRMKPATMVSINVVRLSLPSLSAVCF